MTVLGSLHTDLFDPSFFSMHKMLFLYSGIRVSNFTTEGGKVYKFSDFVKKDFLFDFGPMELNWEK